MRCNGRGDNGDHCCYIAGKVCQFLDTSGEIPRCSLFDEWGSLYENLEWMTAPAGQYFSERYPGFECGRDWPQNIPEVMAAAATAGPFYTCCWGRGNRGDLD